MARLCPETWAAIKRRFGVQELQPSRMRSAVGMVLHFSCGCRAFQLCTVSVWSIDDKSNSNSNLLSSDSNAILFLEGAAVSSRCTLMRRLPLAGSPRMSYTRGPDGTPQVNTLQIDGLSRTLSSPNYGLSSPAVSPAMRMITSREFLGVPGVD